jgi:hypothetical protein
MNRHPIPVSPLETVGVAAARANLGRLDSAEPHDMICERCTRTLCVAVRHHPVPLSLLGAQLVSLNEQDFCRWCARPITSAGEAKVPIAGYLALVRDLVGEQAPGRTFNDDIDRAS